MYIDPFAQVPPTPTTSKSEDWIAWLCVTLATIGGSLLVALNKRLDRKSTDLKKVEVKADDIQKNFNTFTLQSQRDFKEIRLLRGQVLDQEKDIRELGGQMEALRQKDEEREKRTKMLEAKIVEQEGLIRTLTAQNTELTAWKAAAIVRMDEVDGVLAGLPEEWRPNLKSERPNGKTKEKEQQDG